MSTAPTNSPFFPIFFGLFAYLFVTSLQPYKYNSCKEDVFLVWCKVTCAACVIQCLFGIISLWQKFTALWKFFDLLADIFIIVCSIGLVINDSDKCGELHIVALVFYIMVFILISLVLIISIYILIVNRNELNTKTEKEQTHLQGDQTRTINQYTYTQL